MALPGLIIQARLHRRRRPEHAGDLLPRQTTGASDFHSWYALDGAGLAHECCVQLAGDTGDDGAVVAGEVALWQGDGGGAPDVLCRVAEVAGYLAAAGGGGEAVGAGGGAVGGADGGEAGEARG